MTVIGGGEGTQGSKEGDRSEQDEEGRGERLPWTQIVGGRMATLPTGRDPDNCNCKGEGAGDEAKTIAAINVGRINNGTGDPVANKYGYDGNGDGDGDGNGIAMLANGTEVSRRNVDATSKQGDVRWMPLHRVIVVLLNSNITLSQYIINLCTIVIDLNMF